MGVYSSGGCRGRGLWGNEREADHQYAYTHETRKRRDRVLLRADKGAVPLYR